MRKRTLLLSFFALGVSAAAVGFALARRAAEHRLVDLGACLIGEPLAADEKVSDRMLRIELARPERIDPKAPPSWPDTCAGYASDAARSWGLRLSDRRRLEKLAADLDNQTEQGTMGGATPRVADAQKAASADAIPWFRARRQLNTSTVRRPWRPVTMAARQGPAASLPCWSRDSYTAERVILGGPPDCAVISADERLSVIRLARPEDALPPPKRPSREVARMIVREGMSETSCSTARGLVTVATTNDRRKKTHSLVAGFFGQDADTYQLATAAVTSQLEVDEHDSMHSLESSDAVASCGPSEVHVAWSWAASIGGKPHQELVVVTCMPGHCETKTRVVHVETGRHSNCGRCKPSVDQLQLEPLTVIDLFGTTALIWNYRNALRVRIAPLDELDGVVDHVAWYDPDPRKALLERPSVLTSHDVALVIVPADPLGSRVFRVAASGARELTIPK